MNSFNHCALGSVGEWLYRFVLGIEPEAGSAGFSRLALRPHPGGQLSWASGCYQSVRGPIVTRWQRSADRVTFSVELPPNVAASVRIPSGISEAVFEVGSGTHEFSGLSMTQALS
jgi:alpha-L-rhamnosidase